MMLQFKSSSSQLETDVGSSQTGTHELHSNVESNITPESCPLTSGQMGESQAELYKLQDALASCHFTSLMTCPSHIGQSFTHYCTSCDTLVCDKCIEMEHFDQGHVVTSLEQISEDCQKDLHLKADILQKKCDLLDEWEVNIIQTTNDLCRSREIAIKSAREVFESLEGELHRRKIETLGEIEAQYSAKKAVLDQQQAKLNEVIKTMTLSNEATRQAFKPKNSAHDENEMTFINNTKEYEKKTISNNSSISSAAAEGIRTYLLHKHISERLDRRSSFGTTADKSEEFFLHQSNSLVTRDNCLSDDSYLSKNYSSPNENSFLKWERGSGYGKCFNLLNSCEIGRLLSNRAVAHTSMLSGECLQDDSTCEVGYGSHVILITKDFTGQVETCSNIDVNASLTFCDITSAKSNDEQGLNVSRFDSSTFNDLSALSSMQSRDGDNASIPCKVKSSSKEPVEIIFTTPYSGNYLLSVKLYGRHVANSPCKIFAKSTNSTSKEGLKTSFKVNSFTPETNRLQQKATRRPQSARRLSLPIKDDLLLKVGSQGRKQGEFSNPQDVAFDRSGRIYVTDSNNQCIQVFQINTKTKSKIKFIDRFGQKGRGVGQVHRPTGIALLPSGDLAVSDYENKIVNIFLPSGAYKSRIGAGKLMGPRGICVNRDGHLVVVDNKQCQIFVFQLNGRLISKFGNRGTEPHQLAGPHYVAVNKRDEILITDFYNHSVKVFSPTGAYLRNFGSHGEGCGQFNAPTGLCVDQDNHVVVADWGNSRVQIFDNNGSFLAHVNVKDEPLYGPQGVAVTQDRIVAVADSGNQCVKVYKILQ